jgi:hypothetical protein
VHHRFCMRATNFARASGLRRRNDNRPSDVYAAHGSSGFFSSALAAILRLLGTS